MIELKDIVTEEDRQRYLYGCAGKVKHKSQTSIEYALETVRDNQNYNSYLCEFCGFLHIGHIPKDKKKAAK